MKILVIAAACMACAALVFPAAVEATDTAPAPAPKVQTFFSPEDDCQKVILELVECAKTSIRIADYSFVMPKLTDALIAKHQAGVDVQLVLDKIQASGRPERRELLKLKAAGIPFLVGQSVKRRIMHLKVIVVDGHWTLSGSYNLTDTAGLEDNTFDIVDDTKRAEIFTAKWNRVHETMSTQYQPELLPAP